MKNNLKYFEKDYIPDEGEIYFYERLQGKSEKRCRFSLLFFLIFGLFLLITPLVYGIKSLFF
ncbi:MAG TPA: hypothetical protein VJ926_01610 [Patescibacteria group bacterium]|nr:hypothetical protein [Patescibacteria group bacterium]